MEKKKIRERIKEITYIFDDGKLSYLINKLEEIKKESEELGYSDLEIDKEYCCDYYDDRKIEFHLYGTREEADEEYEKRMKLNKRKRETNKQNKVKQKDREIKRLKELMEKYPEEINSEAIREPTRIMNKEKEDAIKKFGCREKNCEYFIEDGVWTFCKAIFTEKSCTYKEGDKYIRYEK